FFLIIDEFQRFGGAAFEEILDETTKGRLSLWLAHQNTSQIPTDVKKTIQGIDQFVFGINDDDAKHYAGLLRNNVAPEVLANLEKGAVYARIDGEVVNFQCPAPLKHDPVIAAAIVAASRDQYYETNAALPLVTTRQSRVIETF